LYQRALADGILRAAELLLLSLMLLLLEAAQVWLLPGCCGAGALVRVALAGNNSSRRGRRLNARRSVLLCAAGAGESLQLPEW
jgi:hypothetical protein